MLLWLILRKGLGLIYSKKIIKGSFFTSRTDKEVYFVKDALIETDDNGEITKIINPADQDYQRTLEDAKENKQLVETRDDEYVLPGFIDLHVHAPQWPQAGLALDQPLNEWLEQYTFPLEAKYQDLEFARKSYRHLTRNLVKNGTTTALYFGTIHEDANLILAEECQHVGQRAFIGQVVMDNPEQTPKYYRDSSTKEALNKTIDFIKQIRTLYQDSDLIQPVVTPRFVPSCTDEALEGLGQIAKKFDVLVQSHCSESDWEHGYAIERFGKTDTEVLKQYGLLNEKSVMAHGTLLTEANMDTFKDEKAAIAHCPISNAYFGNAVLPTRKLLEKKIKVGIGTDISGGFSSSMYRNIQQALISSRMLEDGVNAQKPAAERGVAGARISAKQAFYMATIGGAEALHIRAGQIKVGFKADLQIVRDELSAISSNASRDVFERLMYQTNADNISKVFVSGKLVDHK